MTLSEQFVEIRDRMEKTGIQLKDALSAIDMTFDGQVKGLAASSPYEAFTGLNKLIDRTVWGAKIERFRPKEEGRHFHTLEIRTGEGEILGYLNMLYLKKGIPCYYLVYVEVMPSFRRLGLGNWILMTFMEFVRDKKAVGLLDNIIPPEEPTYEIYTGLGWRSLKDYIGNDLSDGWGNYMVFVPDSIQSGTLKDDLTRILFNLRKRRPVIDMHDNEDMVKRTIEEFRSVHRTLLQLFNEELSSGATNPLMRFMFTRLVIKLVGFRRRIATLIGYTGGESLEQITFPEGVKNLPIQPYSLWNPETGHNRKWGDKEVLRSMPSELKADPTLFIEALPLYKRPYLSDWMERAGAASSHLLKISDLIDIGFDPTRLREFHQQGLDYVFERVSPHLFSSLVKKRRFLKKIERSMTGMRFRGAVLRMNPILVTFRDKGNVYILRKKVGGIHSQEALDQLRTVPYLKEMNRGIGVDRVMINTINDIRDWLKKTFHSGFRQEIEEVAYFFPWNIEDNIPRVNVDITGISFDSLWIA